jgi:hypothetical protein
MKESIKSSCVGEVSGSYQFLVCGKVKDTLLIALRCVETFNLRVKAFGEKRRFYQRIILKEILNCDNINHLRDLSNYLLSARGKRESRVKMMYLLFVGSKRPL